jgi:Family of unknown function (DUF6308)
MVTTVHVGEYELSRDQARDIVRHYGIRHRATVLWYDLAGEAGGQSGLGRAAEPLNAVTLADIVRLVVINAGLRPDDVPALLTAAGEKDFGEVSPGARLQDCVAGSSLYEAATLLYDRFRRPGIGPVKRSKVLRLKRPWLVPIYDTHVHRVYEDRAADLGRQMGDRNAGWWEAARLDLVDGAADLRWLTASLTADDDPRVRRAGSLTELRLLDILIWTLGSEV